MTGLDLKINLNHTDYVYEDSDKFDGLVLKITNNVQVKVRISLIGVESKDKLEPY